MQQKWMKKLIIKIFNSTKYKKNKTRINQD